MQIILLIMIVIILFSSIGINIGQFLISKELRYELDIKNNSLKFWLDEEVDMKRIYKKLSNTLLKDKDELIEKINLLNKVITKRNNLTVRLIKGKINLQYFINKYK